MHISPGYLTQNQRKVINLPLDSTIFLTGPAGTGKTTVGVERLLYFLENGVPGFQILVLVPQRTLAAPYYETITSALTPPGSMPSIITIAGLARRAIDLFWPLIGRNAGFKHPNQPPNFLTLETAQYYMAHVVRPHLLNGFFDGVTLDRNRIYSQILDNLNKAAVNGFSHKEISDRLKSAWVGDSGQMHIYDDVQTCACDFRNYCYEYNLLDFSLQIEIFKNQLWHLPICHQFLTSSYKYLIFDNIEEDTPVTGEILLEWLPSFESTLLIYDQEAGYRRFLGADPDSTAMLAELCNIKLEFHQNIVSSPGISRFCKALENVFSQILPGMQVDKLRGSEIQKNFETEIKTEIFIPQPSIRFYPDMLDWVTEKISLLVDRGTAPGEIVILAPYLSDALRFGMVDRLNRIGIPTYSHRPSRSLSDEPATRCVLTLAKLAHPQWQSIPLRSDVTLALIQALGEIDLIRANLLTQITYQKGRLAPFENLKPEAQDRITYVIGNRYDYLRSWMDDYIVGKPKEFDHFLSSLFGEVLSQPGFGFNSNYSAGTTIASLVESVQKFRRVAGVTLKHAGVDLGKEYIDMVEEGVIASQYLVPWQFSPLDSIFISPAYTFLMSNRPVDFQFWLDVGSRGWYERLFQPLTHPYVLSQKWQSGMPWTDVDEFEASQETLYHLIIGLTRRCRKGIFLGISDLNEQGYDQKGEFLRTIDKALRPINEF